MKSLVISGFVLALLSLSRAALPQTIGDVEEVSADTRVVFGSIEILEDGEPKKFRNPLILIVLPAETTEAITYREGKEGNFFWALEPGNYELLSFFWNDAGTHRTGYIGADFEIRESGGDSYLGSIELHDGQLLLLDKFEQIAVIYDDRFPERQGTSIKQLLERPQSIGNFESVTYPCHVDWNIECDNRFQGVTPISPEVKRRDWPRIDSLTPSFSWVPSQGPDTSYDLVLYEAASFRLSGPRYMRARMVAYKEDLKEPFWQPEIPLKPDTRYYWSVRLRQGDTVSGWSTHGHFVFAVVAWSSSYGQWFSFRTP